MSSLKTLPTEKLVCKRLPDNIYVLKFLISDREPLVYQRKIDIECNLSDFFADPDCFMTDEDEDKIMDPQVPTVFTNGNILVTNTTKYVISVIDKTSKVNIIDEKINNKPKENTECFSGRDLVAVKAGLLFYSTRQETIEYVHNILSKKIIVLIRAPPFCGKTILLKLYREYLLSKGKNAYYIDCSRFKDDITFDESFDLQIGRKWTQAIEEPDTYFLFDEAQLIYTTGSSLWQQVKAMANRVYDSRLESLSKFLIISNSNDQPYFNGVTPLIFNEIIDYNQVALKDSEFNEIYNRYNFIEEFPKIILDVGKFIKSLTQSHVGLVHNTFSIISVMFAKTQPSDSEIINYLLSIRFFTDLDLCRVLPLKLNKYFEEPYISIINWIQSSPTGSFNLPLNPLYKNASQEMIKLGILAQYSIIVGLPSLNITFASPLIKNLFNHKYAVAKYEQDPNRIWSQDQFGTFLIEVLKRFDSKLLQQCKSFGCNGTLLEYMWQKEFYRCAFSLLPTSRYSISPEVGYVFEIPGRIDFYVNNGLQWAIELVKDSDKLKEHIEKFKTGPYHKMISSISQWIILDFRSTPPRSLEPYVWYIMYNHDYTQLTVRGLGSEDHIINLT
jgi:hypothetical protein